MRGSSSVLVLVALVGCGRIAFEPAGDSGVTAPDAPRFGPFTTRRILSSLDSTAREFAVSVSADQREIYFVSNRNGSFVNYRATRASTAVDFDPPALSQYGTFVTANEPALARGGLELYLSDFVTHRPDPSAPWAMPVPDPALANFGGEDFGAHDLHMVMHGANQNTLHEATRASLGSPWTVPQPIVELAGVRAFQNYPTMTDDGLEIFFQAYDVPNGPGVVLHAARVALDQPFGPVTEALSLPSGVSYGDPGISGDGTALYYGSDEGNPGGPSDLWVAERVRM